LLEFCLDMMRSYLFARITVLVFFLGYQQVGLLAKNLFPKGFAIYQFLEIKRFYGGTGYDNVNAFQYILNYELSATGLGPVTNKNCIRKVKWQTQCVIAETATSPNVGLDLRVLNKFIDNCFDYYRETQGPIS